MSSPERLRFDARPLLATGLPAVHRLYRLLGTQGPLNYVPSERAGQLTIELLD